MIWHRRFMSITPQCNALLNTGICKKKTAIWALGWRSRWWLPVPDAHFIGRVAAVEIFPNCYCYREPRSRRLVTSVTSHLCHPALAVNKSRPADGLYSLARQTRVMIMLSSTPLVCHGVWKEKNNAVKMLKWNIDIFWIFCNHGSVDCPVLPWCCIIEPGHLQKPVWWWAGARSGVMGRGAGERWSPVAQHPGQWRHLVTSGSGLDTAQCSLQVTHTSQTRVQCGIKTTLEIGCINRK